MENIFKHDHDLLTRIVLGGLVIFLSSMFVAYEFDVLAYHPPPDGTTTYHVPLDGTTTFNTQYDGFTLNYPESWSYERHGCIIDVPRNCIIIFFNEEDEAVIELSGGLYPELILTPAALYAMIDARGVLDDKFDKFNEFLDLFHNNVFGMYAIVEYAQLSELYDSEYVTDVRVDAVRMFETHGGIPAHEIEFHYTQKFPDTNKTHAFSRLSTTYYLETKVLFLQADSPIEKYNSYKPFFIEATESFDVLPTSIETKLPDDIKKRFLSDMKNFPKLVESLGEIKEGAIFPASIKYEGGTTVSSFNGKKAIASDSSARGGCLVATAVYGSEISQQVQMLREVRDNTLMQTQLGAMFLNGFNTFYYSFSPAVADLQRENMMFNELVRLVITPMIYTLSIMEYVDGDSELDVLVLGSGIILLNAGMYFMLPAFGICMAARKISHRKPKQVFH